MKSARIVCCGSLAALLLIVTLVSGAQAQGPQPTRRFGVDLAAEFGRITDYDVDSLHIACYSDWGVTADAPSPGGIRYLPLVRVHAGVLSPSVSKLGPIVDANPGLHWLIGNEPENIWQDNCTPEMYATAYHEAYTFIKGRDPTAQVVAGGVTQPTPLRLQWLDRALSHYQATYGQPMPVDAWHVHNMILQELKGSWGCSIPHGLDDTAGRLYTVQDNDNVEIFKQHIVEFRVWMRDRGYRSTPLINSEYGVLMPVQYGFTPERVSAFMNATFDYMLTARDPDLGCPTDGDRLVQFWLWNSLNDQPYDPTTGKGFNGALFDYRYPSFPGVITPVGSNYRLYTEAMAAGRVCLTGGISLAGRPSRPARTYVIDVWVTLYPVGGGDGEVHRARTDATGHFGFCNLSPGTYDILAKGSNTLAKRVNGMQIAADAPIVDFGLLIPGDADGDNEIGILDYSILATAYGKCAAEPAFDGRPDLDGDGCIDILDYSLLATHYGEAGDS